MESAAPVPAPAAPREEPRAEAAPAPAAVSAWPSWNGALQSVAADGSGFFDRERARKFSESIDAAQRKYIIELNARSFVPEPGAAGLNAIFENAAGARVAYLQVAEHLNEAQRAELANSGVELLSYTAGLAWTARGTRAAFEAALALPYVRAAAAIDARDKMHAALFAEAFPAYALQGENVRLALIAHRGLNAGVVEAEIARLPALAGASVKELRPSVLGPRFEVTVPRQAAHSVATLNSVAFAGFPAPPVVSRDATIDLSSNIEDVRSAPPGLSGSGVKVSVHEIGRPESHADFAARLTHVENDASGFQTDLNHATGVTGVIAGDGSTQPAARGVAPGAQVLAYSVGFNDPFETADLRDAAVKGARISNHSYGPDSLNTWGDYDPISADWDEAIRANNLVATAAANQETGGLFKHIDFFVGAKNMLCVAAASASARAFDDSPAQPAMDGLASYVEHGPMNDGRIKPDLVAFGGNASGSSTAVQLLSGTNSTQFNSGTSFATPVITGVAALVFQQYRAIFGSDPSAAATKALLCNSATDLGKPGPDAQYGFGIVNAEEAIHTINRRQGSPNSPFLEDGVSAGVSKEYLIDLQNQPLVKLTLCWMDLPGSPTAAKALVNDLNMELEAPDGTKFFAYSLNPADPSAAATRTAANSVDPIEQIVVDSPASGIWKVRVHGVSIPAGAQSFAICCNLPVLPTQLIANIAASPDVGPAPLNVSFSAAGSVGLITGYHWDYGDGTTEDGATLSNTSHTFTVPGSYTVLLTLNGQANGTRTVIVTKPIRSALVSKGRGLLDFRGFVDSPDDDLQFSMKAPELAVPAKEARTQIKNNVLNGKSFVVKLGGKTDNSLPTTRLLTAVIDGRGNDAVLNPAESGDFKFNLIRGEMQVKIRNAPLEKIFEGAGMTRETSSSGLHDLPVEIETENAIYRGVLHLNYKTTNGTSGKAKSF